MQGVSGLVEKFLPFQENLYSVDFLSSFSSST